MSALLVGGPYRALPLARVDGLEVEGHRHGELRHLLKARHEGIREAGPEAARAPGT